MNSHKEEGLQNYISLSLLLDQGSEILRHIFRDRYHRLTKIQWRGDQGKKFMKQLRTAENETLKFTKFQQEIIETGNIDDWDLLTLAMILKLKRVGMITDQKIDLENSNIHQLSRIRQILLHSPCTFLSQSKFDELWSKTARALLGLGAKVEDFDKILQRGKGKNICGRCAQEISGSNVPPRRHGNGGQFDFHKQKVDKLLKQCKQVEDEVNEVMQKPKRQPISKRIKPGKSFDAAEQDTAPVKKPAKVVAPKVESKVESNYHKPSKLGREMELEESNFKRQPNEHFEQFNERRMTMNKNQVDSRDIDLESNFKAQSNRSFDKMDHYGQQRTNEKIDRVNHEQMDYYGHASQQVKNEKLGQYDNQRAVNEKYEPRGNQINQNQNDHQRAANDNRGQGPTHEQEHGHQRAIKTKMDHHDQRENENVAYQGQGQMEHHANGKVDHRGHVNQRATNRSQEMVHEQINADGNYQLVNGQMDHNQKVTNEKMEHHFDRRATATIVKTSQNYETNDSYNSMEEKVTKKSMAVKERSNLKGKVERARHVVSEYEEDSMMATVDPSKIGKRVQTPVGRMVPTRPVQIVSYPVRGAVYGGDGRVTPSKIPVLKQAEMSDMFPPIESAMASPETFQDSPQNYGQAVYPHSYGKGGFNYYGDY